ncbi:hypothetical protein DFH07DRAFT_780267 [Mycena maculata]|uniref:Uncharacterized protein n=1 Tax=Mycena maculata TaxID=230809 RepID=A0AAD7I3V6_9AGAR|nr:hypothetical protein DFH07DRAFT_780267 [Mycena maculata]
MPGNYVSEGCVLTKVVLSTAAVYHPEYRLRYPYLQSRYASLHSFDESVEHTGGMIQSAGPADVQQMMLGRYQICPPFARDLQAGQISGRFDISRISACYLPGAQIQNLPAHKDPPQQGLYNACCARSEFALAERTQLRRLEPCGREHRVHDGHSASEAGDSVRNGCERGRETTMVLVRKKGNNSRTWLHCYVLTGAVDRPSRLVHTAEGYSVDGVGQAVLHAALLRVTTVVLLRWSSQCGRISSGFAYEEGRTPMLFMSMVVHGANNVMEMSAWVGRALVGVVQWEIAALAPAERGVSGQKEEKNQDSPQNTTETESAREREGVLVPTHGSRTAWARARAVSSSLRGVGLCTGLHCWWCLVNGVEDASGGWCAGGTTLHICRAERPTQAWGASKRDWRARLARILENVVQVGFAVLVTSAAAGWFWSRDVTTAARSLLWGVAMETLTWWTNIAGISMPWGQETATSYQSTMGVSTACTGTRALPSDTCKGRRVGRGERSIVRGSPDVDSEEGAQERRRFAGGARMATVCRILWLGAGAGWLLEYLPELLVVVWLFVHLWMLQHWRQIAVNPITILHVWNAPMYQLLVDFARVFRAH